MNESPHRCLAALSSGGSASGPFSYKGGTDMKDKMQVTGMLIAAMAAGYLGGLMSQANTAAVAAGTGPVTSDVVKAKRFELVDAKGETRGLFTVGKDGDPILVLYDSAGQVRGGFSTLNGDPMLVLNDSAGQVRGLFGTLNGDPMLVLNDSAGQVRGSFGVDKDGDPKLALRDSAGKRRGELGTVAGSSMLVLYDSAGKRRGSFAVDKDGDPMLCLRDSAGKAVWSAP